MTILAIHHVQLAMPPGKEDAARQFYVGVLNFLEIPKPANLAKRGGAWFAQGSAQVHLGVESDFRPAKKAHPAFLVENLAELKARLLENNCEVIEDEPLEGYYRFYVSDIFGNRLEFLEKREVV